MKKILTVILALCLMASFTACNNNQNQSGDNMNQSGENQAEGTILSIEGNATTGYTWHATDYDETIIRVEEISGDTANQSNENSEPIVGAPNTFKFRIVGLEGGVTNLKFDYYRSWEGSEFSIETRNYIVTVDNLLNVTVEEQIEIEPDIPDEDDYLVSAEMEALLNDLVTKSEVQFPMPGSSKIILANAPTFVGLSEDLFSKYVVDSVVYEPMISPATNSLCIVKLSEEADMPTLKQTVLDNSNPAKWICTGAEKCLVIESGRYIMLVMSTPENCEALKTAFVEHFGAENVGEALTKDGVANEMPEDNMGGGMAL